MYRQLYQMGGIGTLPMDFGQPLQVPQQPQPSFSSAQNITMNPLLNYGQPQLGGGTPLTMAGGGITRLGYQEGGMDSMMQPQMQEQMMQPSMQNQMQGQETQVTEGDNALLTIIQLLIEQGIPPEQAQELAVQILQAFNQGGEPAVEALANQLEQQEGIQEPMMMAEGGLTSIDRARDMLQRKAPSGEFLAYINPQEAGILKLMGGAGQDVSVRGVPSFFNPFKAVKNVVKGVSKAVKSIAKSDIGRIALTIAAAYFMGPAGLNLGAGVFGATSPFAIGAINSTAANLLVQGITTGKINPKEALVAGALGGTLGSFNAPANAAAGDTLTGTISQPSIQVGSLESNLGQFNPSITPGITGTVTQPSSFFSPTEYGSLTSSSVPTGLEGQVGTGYATPPPNQPFQLQGAGTGSPINANAITSDYSYPNTLDKFSTKISDFGTGIQNFGTNLMNNPLETIGSGVKSAYEYASQNKGEALLAATAALGALSPQQPGEPDDSYQQRKAEHDAKVAQYITQYGGGAKVYSPSFYAMEGAVDPFAGRPTYAAMGGRIGFGFGSAIKMAEDMGIVKQVDNPSSNQSVSNYEQKYRNLTSANFIDENKNGIDDRQESFSYGRIGQAKGSMPMGEPRRNPAGIMELDYRAKGGFVPPVGIKEKADDIPAMLSNNEFVFTANAVRNAGGGNVNKGAERMYGLMKQLEAGGVI